MNEGRDAGRLDFPFVGIPSFLRSPLVQDLGQLDAILGENAARILGLSV
jgi:hypothetical protein